MERGHVTSLVTVDLSAVFDTIDHTVLLDILQGSYGVKGSALRWFDDYLRGRTMQVQIKDALSSPRAMNFSLPQGLHQLATWYSVRDARSIAISIKLLTQL